jgi:hypothetical protein
MPSDPMTVAASLASEQTNSTLQAILWGTLAAGTLDISAAILVYMPRGIVAERVLQSVAGGILGRAAYENGTPAAILGLLLHFSIMSVIVSAFVLASRRFSWLTQDAVAYGALYGVAVYAVMNFIVVPLSAIGGGKLPPLRDLLGQLVIHVVLVGLPIALVARRFLR